MCSAVKKKLGSVRANGDLGNVAKRPAQGDAAQRSLKKSAARLYLEHKLSAKDVSDLARSGASEGASSVSRLARAGNHGKAPKNLARDIMNELLRDVDMPEIFWHKIPSWDIKLRKQVFIDHPFLLVHEMMQHLVPLKPSDHFAIDGAEHPERRRAFEQVCRSLDAR